MMLQITLRFNRAMPARKRPIPVAPGADPADAAAIDWSKFNWMDAERPFRPVGRIPESARRRIVRATNHFARLAEMESAAPPMTAAVEEAEYIQSLTAKLLNKIAEIAPIGPGERRRSKNKLMLAEFLGHSIRQHLQLPSGRNLGRASIGADHLSILRESLRALDLSLQRVLVEINNKEPSEMTELHRWLEHIRAALIDSGLPATASNDRNETPFMALVRGLLKILPGAAASKYTQLSNSALGKTIQRSRIKWKAYSVE
jgi:hypothetical protein